MEEKNSQTTLRVLKKQIDDLHNNLDVLYSRMYSEIKEYFVKKKINDSIRYDEMHVLYNKLQDNEQMKINWIKKKLPWYITKFNKISSNEIRFVNRNIYIGVNFNKACLPNCYVLITPADIGWR